MAVACNSDCTQSDGSTHMHLMAKDNDSNLMMYHVQSRNPEKVLESLYVQNGHRNTPMHVAILSEDDATDWLNAALQIVGIGNHLINETTGLLQIRNVDGETPLSLMTKKARKFDFFLDVFFSLKSDEDRVKLLSMPIVAPSATSTTIINQTLSKSKALHLAITNSCKSSKISKILKRLKPENRVKVLLLGDSEDRTVLQLAAVQANAAILLRSLLDPIKENKDLLYAAMKGTPCKKQSLLHTIAEQTVLNCTVFEEVLTKVKMLGNKDDVLLLCMGDEEGKTVFHRVAQQQNQHEESILGQNARTLSKILECASSYPEFMEMIAVQDANGETALHIAMRSGFQVVETALRALLGTTAIHTPTAIKDTDDTVKTRLKLDQLKDLMMLQNTAGDTIFHIAAQLQQKEAIDHIFDHTIFVPKTRLEFLRKLGSGGKSVLHMSLQSTSIVKSILSSLDVEDRCSLLSVKARDGSTALHELFSQDIDQPTIVEFLNSATARDLEFMFAQTNNDGDTPLHNAADSGCLEGMKKVITLLPAVSRLKILKQKAADGSSVFQRCLPQPQIVSFIADELTSEDLYILVSEVDNNDQTALHKCMLMQESKAKAVAGIVMGNLFKGDCGDQARQLLLHSDKNSDTCFHIAAGKDMNSVIQVILKNTAEDMLPALLLVVDGKSRTLLHCFAENADYTGVADVLELVVGKMKCKDMEKVLQEKDDDGNTCLHLAALQGNSRMIEIVLKMFDAPKDRLKLLKIKGPQGNTVLHQSSSNVEAVRMILDCCNGQASCFTLASLANSSGQTVLHKIVSNDKLSEEYVPQILKVLFDSLVAEDHLKLQTIGDVNRETAYHLASKLERHSALIYLLDILDSGMERLEALKTEGAEGKSVLHECGKNHETLRIVLDKLDDEHQQAELIGAQDDFGDNILNHLIKRDYDDVNANDSLSLIMSSIKKCPRPKLERILTTVNILQGSPLLYAIDKQDEVPIRLQTLTDILEFKHVLSLLSFSASDYDVLLEDLRSNADAYLVQCHLKPFTTEQLYFLRRICGSDMNLLDTEREILLSQISAQEETRWTALLCEINNHGDQADVQNIELLIQNKYDNGNGALHKLASSTIPQYEAIQKYLHLLDDQSRKSVLSFKNRLGKTAVDITNGSEIESLLQWSKKQDGFYYLSNPPTVLLMYSTIAREGFEVEVEAFVRAMKIGLDIRPTNIKDPTASKVLEEIRRAQAQPNISALIVVYMSHGSGGYVETADRPLAIQAILFAMCSPRLTAKPKVLMLQACQVNIRTLRGINTLTLIQADALPWFSDEDQHFDVTFADVVAIVASVNGGVSYRGLMIPKFAVELQRAREEQEKRKKADEPDFHCDITELFYKTHAAVREELKSYSISEAQICELRTTLIQKLSLTNMFKPPRKPPVYKCVAFRYV